MVINDYLSIINKFKSLIKLQSELACLVPYKKKKNLINHF